MFILLRKYKTLGLTLYTILFSSICSGELIRPLSNQKLNYVHVLFEWDQEPGALFYQFELTDLLSDSVVVIDSIKVTLLIEKSNIKWERFYQWRIRWSTENSSYSPWTVPSSFSINESKIGNLNITNYQDSLIQPGLTMFGGPNPTRHTIVIDRYGKEIWNDGEFKFKINYVDKYGSIYGNSDHLFPNNTACKINYDMDILWSSDQEVDPHDLKETQRNTFLTLRNIYSNGPIPSDISLTNEFRMLGFAADDTTNEFPWYGQEIVEFNKDNEVIWTWSPFDHYSLDDYDNHGHTWQDAFINMKYDWTHSNALYFDENESAIYLSSRHISRVTKIDYPSGEVIYNISLPSPYIASGDSQIGNDLLFNFQHHIQQLDNGNLTLFDNGNISNHLFDHGIRRSRALEFEVVGDSICNLVWSYNLPSSLYGRAGGSMQVLDNNNRLIFTRGNSFGGMDNPTIIEVTNDQEVVWKMNAPNFYAWYRAYRIPSIHPDAFSVTVSPYTSLNVSGPALNVIPLGNEGRVVISIHNKSDYAQPYQYKIRDDSRWIQSISGIIEIAAGEKLDIELEYLSSAYNRNTPYTDLDVVVIPVKHSFAKKHKIYRVFDFSNSRDLTYNLVEPVTQLGNSPNPFNPVTNIKYELLESGPVKIVIYDTRGRIVKEFVDDHQSPGFYSLQWNATNNSGQPVSSGVYLYSIQSGDLIQSKKMIFLK
tara:strand:- start:17143 stop:19260 length:2118 start_codon:yes stop_codon:yes gene_type:complete